jgi:NADPH-dependent ferric siderophore reductase
VAGSVEAKHGSLRLLERLAHRATVERVEHATRRMRGITIVGTGLIGLDWMPGQQVRVMFKDPTQLRTWLSPRDLAGMSRTYSLWDYDREAGRYQLIVMDHAGDGPGTRWSRTVQPGDTIFVGSPEGRFVARVPSSYHLFIGEETAAVCFGAILRGLPAGTPALGVLQAGTPEDHLDLPGGDGFVRVELGDRVASPSQVLLDAVRSLILPEGAGTAYLAGEAKTIQAIRRHLLNERGWTRPAILTKPFWTPGKRGLE